MRPLAPRTAAGPSPLLQARPAEAATQGPDRSNCSTARPPRPAARPRRRPLPRAKAPARRSPPAAIQVETRKPVPAPRTGRGAAAAGASQARGNGPAKLFVLDTNVLLHDPTSLFRFEEHDIYLPMITLEELDNHKKGMTEVARNARQVSRDLDAPAPPRARSTRSRASRCRRRATAKPAASCSSRPSSSTPRRRRACRRARPTTRSWRVVQALREQHARRATWCWCPRTSTCASRRARWACPPRTTSTTRRWTTATCSTPASSPLPADFWDKHGKTMESWNQGGHTFYRIVGPLVPLAADQPVRLPRDARRRAAVRARHRDHRQVGGAARRCKRLHARRRTPSGASPRATASRTSRSTC